MKKGILVVSFGTTHPDTRRLTIEAIERRIEKAFPDYSFYRAFTSGIIIKKMKEREGISVMTVRQALKAMHRDGIRDVVIQPTHVINGVENDKMREEAMELKGWFSSLKIGDALLTTGEDNRAVIQAVAEEYGDLKEKEALVFMGHGTTHYANAIYAALDYEMKDMGYKNMFLGTVEAYPSLTSIFRILKEGEYTRVCLAPFMIVAGDHAKNDLSGASEDSWYTRFLREGYEVRCVLKGLGEIPGIQELLAEHAKRARGYI